MQPTAVLGFQKPLRIMRAFRKLPLTTKDINKGFYKGNRTGSMGRHTRFGGYVIEWNKVRTYVVPEGLEDFKVSPLASSRLRTNVADRKTRPIVALAVCDQQDPAHARPVRRLPGRTLRPGPVPREMEGRERSRLNGAALRTGEGMSQFGGMMRMQNGRALYRQLEGCCYYPNCGTGAEKETARALTSRVRPGTDVGNRGCQPAWIHTFSMFWGLNGMRTSLLRCEHSKYRGAVARALEPSLVL
jgi:hypothetical protein